MSSVERVLAADADDENAEPLWSEAVANTVHLPLFNDRYELAYPNGSSTPRLVESLPLSDILADHFLTDAHFAPYVSESHQYRLKKESAAEARPKMELLVFDVDDEDAHALRVPSTEVWWEAEKERLMKLREAFPGAYIYRTRGGYRIVFILPEPFLIDGNEAAERWKLFYERAACFLARRFGIVPDLACSSWTRLFRAPHATREGETVPEDREVIGDPRNISVFTWSPNDEELSADIAVAKMLPQDHGWGALARRLQRRLTPDTRTSFESPGAATATSANAYGEAALKNAVARILAAAQRNVTLNAEAFGIGRILKAAGLDETAVEEQLVGAAEAAGLSESEARRTFFSGFEAGLAKPREIGTRVDPLERLKGLPATAGGTDVETALRDFAGSLGGQDPLARARLRDEAITELKRLGVGAPAGLVDAALALAGKDGGKDVGGSGFDLSDPEPWPDPVGGTSLLDDLESTVKKFIAMSEEAVIAVVLWIIFTFLSDAFDVSPILSILSPDRRCGKTKLCTLLTGLVRRALLSSNMTAAALFRTIESFSPTLLADEGDTFLKFSDDLRNVMNAGHTRQSAVVIRCSGDDHEPRSFSVWCPKVIAAIGSLPSTIEDRSVIVSMRRRAPGEKVERLRIHRLKELEPIRRKAARWAADHLETLQLADPVVPDLGNDRAEDNWRPLLAIADEVGGTWPERARKAAKALSGEAESREESSAALLLEDLRKLFDATGATVLPTKKLIEELSEMEDRPWAEFSKGKPISAPSLAKLLRPFGAKPKSIRIGVSTAKGYERADLEDAFTRYVPSSGGTSS